MKVILTGATGFIGGEVLRQALLHPSITTLIVLSRRAISPPITHPKLQVIILADFAIYPPEVLTQLDGAEACIWYLHNPPPPEPLLAYSNTLPGPLASNPPPSPTNGLSLSPIPSPSPPPSPSFPPPQSSPSASSSPAVHSRSLTPTPLHSSSVQLAGSKARQRRKFSLSRRAQRIGERSR